MPRTNLPAVIDLAYHRLASQFSRAPGDPLFNKKRAFCLTRVQAAAAWSLEVQYFHEGTGTLRGTGPTEFVHPQCVKNIGTATGIQELVGFHLPIGSDR